MEKKEIVIVAEHFTAGGAERVISELVTEWSKEGHKVTAVLIRADKYPESYDLPSSMKIIVLKSSNNRFIRRIQNAVDLVKILKKCPNAIIISFVEPAMLVVALASPFIKNKIIFSERCDPQNNPPQRKMRVVRNLIFNIPEKCVFQTEDAKSYFSERIQKKGVIIPNPVNPDLPDPYKGERKKEIAYVGRFVPQKNIPMLLEAFKKLSSEYPEYILRMFGRGFEDNDVMAWIKRNRLEGKIVLEGFQNNVTDLIKECALYVSSSDYEGISNSMLEALAMGIPTVVTDCPVGGAKQTIENGKNGLLVPVGDVEALYKAMKQVIENKELAQQLSRESIKIREQYPVEKIANMWLELM